MQYCKHQLTFLLAIKQKLNYFLLEELKQTDFYGCYSNCETCFDKLGTKPEFVATFKSLYVADSLAFGIPDSLYALTLYDSLFANCQSIQSQCGQQNVCDGKLAMLKMDIRPGGQYALYDSAYNLLEIPINRLAMRSQLRAAPDEAPRVISVPAADAVAFVKTEHSDVRVEPGQTVDKDTILVVLE